MEIEEFEQKYAEPPADVDESDGGEELLMLQDLHDGVSLLSKVKTLLDYTGNIELCKSLTKRERETMAKISGEVGDYLDSVSGHYEEE